MWPCKQAPLLVGRAWSAGCSGTHGRPLLLLLLDGEEHYMFLCSRMCPCAGRPLEADPPLHPPRHPQVAPITVLKSEYRLQVVHQITSNASYICYGLKQGHIRVLNKDTANRALLKGHGSMVGHGGALCVPAC